HGGALLDHDGLEISLHGLYLLVWGRGPVKCGKFILTSWPKKKAPRAGGPLPSGRRLAVSNGLILPQGRRSCQEGTRGKKKNDIRKSGCRLVGCPEGLEPSISRSTIWRVNRLRYGHHSNAPEGTRTPGPLLRRQLLYPAELRAHVLILWGFFLVQAVRHRLREI